MVRDPFKKIAVTRRDKAIPFAVKDIKLVGFAFSQCLYLKIKMSLIVDISECLLLRDIRSHNYISLPSIEDRK